MSKNFKYIQFSLAILFLLPEAITAQCIAPGTCSGTEIASSGNVTILAGTTGIISVGNTSSANITFGSGASVLCIGGTFTGTINGDPPAGATINCYGTINSNNNWDFSGGGLTINITEGASMTVQRFKVDGGAYTITNCGDITFTSATGLVANGGTFTINNYASININGSGDVNGGLTWNNYPASQLYVGGSLDIAAGTFVNSGNLCVTSTTTVSGGSFTNNECFRTTTYVVNGSGAFTNNKYIKIVGNFTNNGSNNANNGTMEITGNYSGNGTFTLGSGSLLTCVNWTANGNHTGPGSDCAQIRATGVTTLNGNITAGNSSRVYFYDSGTPAAGWDSKAGNSNSAKINDNTCSVTNYPACSMAGSACTTVLPIELLIFAGKPQEKNILLNWATATEINNNYFVIERSADAQTFEAIGNLPGAGNSNHNIDYHLLDKEPISGINYYRLKQVDYDGNYSYSRIIAIDMNASQDLKLLYLFPDATQHLQYQVSSSYSSNLFVEVLDVLGKKVLADKIYYDVIDDGMFYSLDATVLNKGVYFFRISDGKTVVVKKFVY